MEDLFARERAAEQNVRVLLKKADEPMLSILRALEEYRRISQQATFADFEHGADRHSARLWSAHTETRKLLHGALATVRSKDEPLIARQITKLYLHFVKDSQRFYREYVFSLNNAFGGIPELEAAAHKVKVDDAVESPPTLVAPSLHAKALEQCHQALIYLGDISRYRASEKLDKSPDFGPAIGYYGLACLLFPSSGMGHHQQAVVALEQQQHLRAIYHLYRAIMVDEPHPNAKNNLRLEFDKTNAAWERGELIHKGQPNDPDGPRRALIGWFVRLHSMCVKGERFRGYDELEREVLGQLAAEIKQRPLDGTLMRMIMVNIAAQDYARDNFQNNPTDQYQHAFFQFFRFNIRTFTTLLQAFYEELLSIKQSVDVHSDVDLVARLSPVLRRLLPGLRLYTSWLLLNVHLLGGLSEDEFLSETIMAFWPAYAKAVDLVAAVFPIWDLEDNPPLTYLLEEDSDTLGFNSFNKEGKFNVWTDTNSKSIKPRFSDRGVNTLSAEEEALARVMHFLNVGLFLANDEDQAPIKLRGTRVLTQDAEEPEPLPMPTLRENKPLSEAKPAPTEPSKPLTYAAAAKVQPKAMSPPKTANDPSAPSIQAELNRMVDNLVDEDAMDGITQSSNQVPVNPPLQPSIERANKPSGRAPLPSANGSWREFAAPPNYTHSRGNSTTNKRSNLASPLPRTKPSSMPTSPRPAHSISSIWDQQSARQPISSPKLSSNVATGPLSSPSLPPPRSHSRGDSITSIRSGTMTTPNVGNVGDNWSSLEPVPHAPLQGLGAATMNSYAPLGSPIASSLLFGAGGSLWSTGSPRTTFSNTTPPNGQGG